MALERDFVKQFMVSHGDKEATYNAGPAAWTSGAANSLIDWEPFDPVWNDTHQADTDVVTGHELQSVHKLVRQSVTLAYNEPRTKPHSLATFMALSLGTIVSTQDGTLTAYRHKITPASSIALPSIAAQVKYDGGTQWKYTGVKGDGFTLENNDAFFRFQSPMVGSGTRATASDAFPAAITEDWLLWGNSAIYLKNTAGTPISIPATPSQSAANLGGSEVDLSSYMLRFSLQWQNNLQPDMGYRPSTAKVRQNFHPNRRVGSVTMQFEVDSASEAAELNYYINQSQLALELTINSGTLIAVGGAFYYGMTLLIPRVQIREIPRGATQQLENLTYTMDIMEDGTNPYLVPFVFNATAVYLA